MTKQNKISNIEKTLQIWHHFQNNKKKWYSLNDLQKIFKYNYDTIKNSCELLTRLDYLTCDFTDRLSKQYRWKK